MTRALAGRVPAALFAALVMTLILAGSVANAEHASGADANEAVTRGAGVAPKLFIHGYKGGRLVAPDGTLRWAGARQALGCGPSIALPLRWGADGQARDELRPDGVLERVRVVPLLLDRPVYAPWLRFARTRWGDAWHELAYDWRRDGGETLARFSAEVEALARASGRRVDVVAHSMGGLVTLAHLFAGGDRSIGRVVFAGVPFAGGIGFLRDLHVGTPTGLDRRLLAPAAQCSFPAVYALFPLGMTRLRAHDGRPIDVDFFAAEDWLREGLGIFADPAAATPEQVAFLRHALAAAAAFRARLAPSSSRPPDTAVLAVIGRGHPTLVQAVKDGPRAVRGWDFESAEPADGDGRVRVDSARPPAPLAYDELFTGADHANLLNDAAVQQAIAEFLR